MTIPKKLRNGTLEVITENDDNISIPLFVNYNNQPQSKKLNTSLKITNVKVKDIAWNFELDQTQQTVYPNIIENNTGQLFHFGFFANINEEDMYVVLNVTCKDDNSSNQKIENELTIIPY